MEKSRRAELKFNYKQTHRPTGVYQLKNERNGKVLVGTSPNLDGIENRHRFQLKSGMHPNKELQQDWNQQGGEHFSFEILEKVKPHDDVTNLDYSEELQMLEEMWLEKLQPYGENGYNKRK
ncbi:MAG: GIY-YIG nuclease family protein [Tumebacillaceae bacterium]